MVFVCVVTYSLSPFYALFVFPFLLLCLCKEECFHLANDMVSFLSFHCWFGSLSFAPSSIVFVLPLTFLCYVGKSGKEH
jgi:hypothetical protein